MIDTHTDVEELEALVAEARAHHASDPEAGLEPLARALAMSVFASMSQSEPEDSLETVEAHAQEAVERLLECLERAPERDLEALLGAVLHAHHLILMMTDREAAALASARRVVAFFEAQSDAEPDYRRGQALGLGALALLTAEDDADAARGLLQEAVALHEQLVEEDPLNLPALLEARVALAQALEAADEDEEALEALDGFVERALALVGDEAAFEGSPELVAALGAGLQLKVGLELTFEDNDQEALDSALALDALNVRAVALDPSLLPLILESATMVSDIYSALDRSEEALARAEAAVQTYRDALAARPDDTSLQIALAQSLGLLETSLSELGRYDDAVATLQEAIPIYRGLLDDGVEIPVEAMAAELNDLGVALSVLERHEEALSASREAVTLFGQLAIDDPEEHLPSLADSLDNLSVDLAELGHFEDAFEAAHDAAQIFRSLLNADA